MHHDQLKTCTQGGKPPCASASGNQCGAEQGTRADWAKAGAFPQQLTAGVRLQKQTLPGMNRMGLPAAQEARPFYRAGKQRFEDARVLLEKAERTTGAIYLAGYGVECLLKALVLSVVPAGDRHDMVANFRGARAHNYDWLKARYFENGGAPFPSEISKALALVNTWDTEWRYRSGLASRREAEDFLRTAEAIIIWADGRL